MSTSWAGQAVAGVVVFPRSILHIGTWYAIFRHGVDHVPTNNWEAPLFCFAFFFERYDRYNDPKNHVIEAMIGDLSRKIIFSGRLSVSFDVRFKREVKSFTK